MGEARLGRLKGSSGTDDLRNARKQSALRLPTLSLSLPLALTHLVGPATSHAGEGQQPFVCYIRGGKWGGTHWLLCSSGAVAVTTSAWASTMTGVASTEESADMVGW